MNADLLLLPTAEEVLYALFQMHPIKAPGVDGMHAIFFQKFWPIVGASIVSFIQQRWNGGVSLNEINTATVTLIPKVADATNMKDFRPISLCQSKFYTYEGNPSRQSIVVVSFCDLYGSLFLSS
ncbi:hypothetical protein V2J09_003210 [Rumex salicifolius]